MIYIHLYSLILTHTNTHTTLPQSVIFTHILYIIYIQIYLTRLPALQKTSLMHYGKGGSKCLGQCDGDKGKYACFVDCNANDILQEWKWKSMSLA